jgi:hypothetical protein
MSATLPFSGFHLEAIIDGIIQGARHVQAFEKSVRFDGSLRTAKNLAANRDRRLTKRAEFINSLQQQITSYCNSSLRALEGSTEWIKEAKGVVQTAMSTCGTLRELNIGAEKELRAARLEGLASIQPSSELALARTAGDLIAAQFKPCRTALLCFEDACYEWIDKFEGLEKGYPMAPEGERDVRR